MTLQARMLQTMTRSICAGADSQVHLHVHLHPHVNVDLGSYF